MKKKIAPAIVTLSLLVGSLAACSPSVPQKVERTPVIYTDDYITISYVGCVEDEMPWMTERGFETIPVKGVALSIKNKAEHSFFVAQNSLCIDGGENVTLNLSESCTYRLYAESTEDYVFYTPKLDTLTPESIKMDMMAFAIGDEFPDFEQYDFTLEVSAP